MCPVDSSESHLRAAHSVDVALSASQRRSLPPSICASCSFNPNVTCMCPVCEHQCKSSTFYPFCNESVEQGTRLLARRQADVAKKKSSESRSSQFRNVRPGSTLSSHLAATSDVFISALPSEALEGDTNSTSKLNLKIDFSIDGVCLALPLPQGSDITGRCNQGILLLLPTVDSKQITIILQLPSSKIAMLLTGPDPCVQLTGAPAPCSHKIQRLRWACLVFLSEHLTQATQSA